MIRPDTVAAWTGSEPTLWWRPFTVFGQELQLSSELVQVSAFLAGFAGLYFSVYAVTDATFRAEFYDDVTAEVREALAVRAAYLAAVPAETPPDAGEVDAAGVTNSGRPRGLYPGVAPADQKGATAMNEQQLAKIRSEDGFIAALDQSGGSTPKALRAYGVDDSAYSNNDEMFEVIHEMRTRIITSPSFNGDRILGAILFENTMDREIDGEGSAAYLWNEKRVVPFLKVDKGLADEENGVQLMKPIPGLDALLARAKDKGVFGTKMRSVIKLANPEGVRAIADQQFEIGKQILAAGLVPIIEPEIDIHSPEKAEAEALLKAAILEHLASLEEGQQIMLKLTLPDQANFYADLVNHPKVLKVVALSGGYTREDANARLAQNNGMVASFSRALTEGLSAQQADDEFDKMLDESIGSIFEASRT
jgi:fructose-bisphosphate aldolase class I